MSEEIIQPAGSGKTRYKWTRFPAEWVRREGLVRFIPGKPGATSLVALKVYLGILSWFSDDVWGTKPFPEKNPAVPITYPRLMANTALDKNSIVRGLGFLKSEGLIEIDPGKGKTASKYSVTGNLNHGFAMVPRMLFEDSKIKAFEESNLRGVHNREACGLDALKVYMVFLAMRDHNLKFRARISYEKICKYSGVPHSGVSDVLGFLGNLGLITTEFRERLGIGGSNLYFIHGLSDYSELSTAEFRYLGGENIALAG